METDLMALRKKGKWWYSDAQADIREELKQFGRRSYVPTEFADCRCTCASATFRLRHDEVEGAAERICSKCGKVHAIGDSAEYLDGAELEECACACGNEALEITVGVALYEESEDVRWLYIGCRCPDCGLTACYADWKNEFLDYRKLISQV